VDTMRPRQDDGNQILLREDALAWRNTLLKTEGEN
jgi:hypothetical protein